MPIHDWTRVDAGTWHTFHYRWVSEIERALNAGILPDGYYADPERPAPPAVPDVLTLQEASSEIADDADDEFEDGDGSPLDGGGVATATSVAAPRLSYRARATLDPDAMALLRRTIAVRHESGDRLVALLELASPANKDRRASVESFAGKAAAALGRGVHVSVVDLFPPRRHDAPAGLVGAVAEAIGLDAPDPPPAKPLMIGAFESAAGAVTLHAEPLAVGDDPPDLPLFYRRGRWVAVPLAATYAAAWAATPRRWRAVIEG